MWGTVSDASWYTKVIDKLKEYVTVHFRDQATVVARATEEFKALIFMKKERPVRIYWSGTSRDVGASNKRNQSVALKQ